MTLTGLMERARERRTATAVLSGGGRYTYADLLDASAAVATALLGGKGDLEEERVALAVPPGGDYVAAQWGVWRAGGIAVPLSATATPPELQHVLADAGIRVALVARGRQDQIEPLGGGQSTRVVDLEDVLGTQAGALPRIEPERRAMILYTSGTTSRPKGVVTTHANIEAQITALVEAWEWTSGDRIPLFLPLHHVHGIVNVLGCALRSGAVVEAFEAFDRERILGRVGEKAYTLFMAVPTVYVKLIQALRSAAPEEKRRWVDGFAALRLMVSGSAALPASVHEEWTALTGQRLLERYGMTEIGMALSNPLHGERRPGAVGRPLPGVDVRLTTETGEVVEGESEPGEIQVRGPGVFREYWNQPRVTQASFVDGWFRTGDVAVREDGYYRILGRLSVDIIKTGGHKVSALEIEDALRQHPDIVDCAVVGVADDTWGEIVAVAATAREGAALDLAGLQAWAGERLSRHKIPRRLEIVSALPRNAMGKVVKPAVRDLFVPSPEA
jgi:malonyl-CoA/methylmalonyl-CoA synthetase